MSDDVTHPKHYSWLDPEPIDVIAKWQLNFNLGNTVKYVARAGFKDGASRLSDLKKAAYYLNHEIQQEEASGQ